MNTRQQQVGSMAISQYVGRVRNAKSVFSRRFALGSLFIQLASCALPLIHRDDAGGKDAGGARKDAAVIDAAIQHMGTQAASTDDSDASAPMGPEFDPANRNEDFVAFQALVPKEHIFAEWPMPDTSEHSKFKPSYTASEQVVTDNVTKLRWQRVLPDIYPGCSARYTYVDRAREVGSGCTWEEASVYCASPELARKLGGGTWRVPTKIELESLIDTSRVNAVDPLFDGFPIDFVWTSSPFPNPDGLKLSWNIDFMDGNTNNGARFKGGRVRCVASANQKGGSAPDYERLHKEVVRDKRSQLEWQQTPDSATRNWAEATEYCRGLALDGGGWRLPSLKELLTIVDSSRHRPSIASRWFLATQNERYWTSTEFVDGRDCAFQVEFAQGGTLTKGSLSDEHYMRCVR